MLDERCLDVVKVLVNQSCPTLCDRMDCSLPGSSVHRILQARKLEWVANSFSRGSSWPRDQTQVSCIVGRFCAVWATKDARKEKNLYVRKKHVVFCGPDFLTSFFFHLLFLYLIRSRKRNLPCLRLEINFFAITKNSTTVGCCIMFAAQCSCWIGVSFLSLGNKEISVIL